MKKHIIIFASILTGAILGCNNSGETTNATTDNTTQAATTAGGQEAVKDDESAKDVVKIAVGSKDHTTLVAALKQADLVTSLSNAGPFTVFAPTNDAFNKLPAGTVEGLMKDEKKEDLQNILQYHVTVSTIKAESFIDGQTLGMVNGDNITVSVKDGKVTLNGNAHIIASIPASNGIIHVVDAVLLPPAKK
ncbi:MAG: fasciclin domain-containing protein [Chitinophagaceae bacterium]|nr:fasciclin domain-containing protein [Chitinophagaceae bacterium]